MHQKINFPWWFVIVLLAAFTVGYYAWSESLRDDQSIIQNSPPPLLFDKEGKGEFSGWQTYRNPEYGFEVKYPTLSKNHRINIVRGTRNVRIEFDTQLGE